MRMNIALCVLLSVIVIASASRNSVVREMKRVAGPFGSKYATKFDLLQTKRIGLCAQFPIILNRGRPTWNGGVKEDVRRLPIEWLPAHRTNADSFNTAVNVAFYHLRDLLDGVTKDRSSLYIPNHLVQEWKAKRLVEYDGPTDLQIEQLQNVVDGILQLQDELEAQMVEHDQEQGRLISKAVTTVYDAEDATDERRGEGSSSTIYIVPEAGPLSVPEGFTHAVAATFGFDIFMTKPRAVSLGLPLAHMNWEVLVRHLPLNKLRTDPLPWGRLSTAFHHNSDVLPIGEIKQLFVLVLKDLEFTTKVKKYRIDPIIQSHVDMEVALSVLEKSPYVKKLIALGDKHSRPESVTFERLLFDLTESTKHYIGTSAVFIGRTLAQANMYPRGGQVSSITHTSAKLGFQSFVRQLEAQWEVNKVGAAMHTVLSTIRNDYDAKFAHMYALNRDLLKKNGDEIEWMRGLVKARIHSLHEQNNEETNALNTMSSILDQLKDGSQTGMSELDFHDFAKQLEAL